MDLTTADNPTRYAYLLGGITGLIFGAVLLVRQDQVVGVAMLLIGLWWLIHGAFLGFSVLIDRTGMWWKLLLGLIGVSAGIVSLANPVQTGQVLGSALTMVLGILGLGIGGVSVIGSFRGGGPVALVFGLVSVGIGLLLMLYPDDSFSTLVTVLGIILIAESVVALVSAFSAK